jgi:hypothetical protein
LGVVKAFATVYPTGGLSRKGLPAPYCDVHENRIDFDAIANAPG